MLNPTFPRLASSLITSPYVLNGKLANNSVAGNESFDTGIEHRTQKVYSDELWLKLERGKLFPEFFESSDILEVCAGTGFLTYHLLNRCRPKSLTVNDISDREMESAKELMKSIKQKDNIHWVLGDMHKIEFDKLFDVIIGNSFLHHFHDVPNVLSRFAKMLKPGGVFVSLHEPTPMSTVVEGAKVFAYPLAVLFPKLVNDVARYRYSGTPSSTDLWMFEPQLLKRVLLQSGFSKVSITPWNLFRPIVVQKMGLHLGLNKPKLNSAEASSLRRAFLMDSNLNRVLPSRFFGSLCIVCTK